MRNGLTTQSRVELRGALVSLNSKTSEVKDHATYSASGAERWLNCHASIKLSEQAPPQRESEYAAEGTAAHACLEFLLKNRKNLKAALKTAATKWDGDMVEHAKFAVDTCLAWLDESPGAELLTETRVDSSHVLEMADQFGTLDVAIVQEFGRLRVVDYKYGMGYAVEPGGADGNGNPQLIYYAAALFREYGGCFDEVELAIIQPRAYHESGDVVRTFLITDPVVFFQEWEEKFRDAVRACESPNPKPTAGAWCKWCPAATICPELKTAALKRAQVVFSDEKGLESVPEPTMIQLPNLSTILQACDRLEDWIGKVRDHAHHVLEKGEEIPGFKLVAKRSPRRWVDEGKSGDEARERFGDLAFTSPRLLSPAQLEKAARNSKGVNEWVQARITDESSGVTLVTDADKRPAVRRIEQVFAEPVTILTVKALPNALHGLKPKSGKRK